MRLSLALSVTLGLFLGACDTVCRQPLCVGGFVWIIKSEAPENSWDPELPLPEGSYDLVITAESTTYEVRCDIGETVGFSYCLRPERVSGDQNWSVEPVFNHLGGLDEDVVSSIYVYVAADGGGKGKTTRAPRTVELQLWQQDDLVFDKAVTPEIDRNERFYGDPDCGWCETAPPEVSVLASS